jgi:hypothetical protein
MTPGTFAAIFAALYAGHVVGDLVVQTHWQSQHKAERSWRGVVAMAGHLAGYATTQIVALIAVTTVGARFGLAASIAGLAFSVSSHGFIDRRWPVVWILDRTGSAQFARLASGGVNGAFQADQALHVGCCFIAALIMGWLS